MSPSTPSPTGPLDGSGGSADRVPDVLAGLRDGVAALPPRSAAAARRTASRRQGARLAVAAVAVAAVVVGVPLGVSLGTTQAAPPVAPSAVSPSPEPSSPAPSVVPSVPPPVPAPVPSSPQAGPPSSQPSAPPSGVQDPGPTVVPPPAGGLDVTGSSDQAVTAGELAGVDLGLDADVGHYGRATWSLDPCMPTAWPSDARRTGWASQGVAVGDGSEVREVAVYAAEADAVAALAAFRRVVAACWAPPGDPSATSIWAETTAEGDEATVFAGLVRSYDPDLREDDSGRDGTAWVAVREGRTVALVTSSDDYFGGWVAAAQGDTRPGAGAGATLAEGAADYVDVRLADVRATAQQILDDVAR